MKVYTTGQVGRICRVATSTVNKWFDSGRLKGYRVPGSRHRRIPRENLIDFLKRHGVPLGNLAEDAIAKVLIVSQDQVLVENLKRALSPKRWFRVAVAGSGFETGIQAEELQPDCAVVDSSIGKAEALQICRKLRRSSATADAVLIALLPDDNGACFDRSLVDEAFRKPFDVALLAERLRTLLGAQKELA
jgi:excisionase family DNA binding protein